MKIACRGSHSARRPVRRTNASRNWRPSRGRVPITPRVRCPRSRQLAQHPVIGLRVAADHEYLRADLYESTFAIESLRPRIALPDAQPQFACATRTRDAFHLLHQRPRQPAPLERFVDIEALELDRLPGGHAGR